MKVNGIFLKLGFIMMVLFLVILLPLGFIIDRIFLEIYSEQVHQNVNQHANKLKEALENNFRNDPKIFDYLTSTLDEEILIFDEKGVILSNPVLEFQKGQQIQHDLLQILREGKYFDRGYKSLETSEEFFFVGRPLIVEGKFSGGIFVFSSIDKIHQLMHSVRHWIIVSIIGSVILAFCYTLFVSRKFSKPLIEMEEATRKIAKGNLTTHIQIKSNDEIGSLGKAINKLSLELNNYRTNRSELLANISHELRTPISYLKGYAQLIKTHQYSDEKELESYSIIIENESDRLSKLIQDLFELSKMEEGKVKLYHQLVDIEELIDEATRKVKVKARRKDLELVIIKNTLPSIYSDGTRIHQILINLLENAIYYTEKGKIVVTAEQQNGFILITVKDTGIGIPEEDLPFIFDRFHRVEKSRSREMGGTGLGLAIVYELVKLLRGSVTVTSKYGYGTEFCVSLPLNIEH
ncbi:HAMP domain-containing sensor histidine kinase [Robertmurraya sp. DFI.2.37]|uniref:sensor histidine kinase n=1 Tax=Robertmurraya sp. DFI.2.37 TaxID=3031819 RepID=UPI001248994B|nr:HAMP domain-containing sensor histidine kinase [Robertmurraya sp. DFI.2.37]MDF1507911.1 HAMP domain-containing sensor histidine kinase [Robertmurraya sp. DFI.2.37]